MLGLDLCRSWGSELGSLHLWQKHFACTPISPVSGLRLKINKARFHEVLFCVRSEHEDTLDVLVHLTNISHSEKQMLPILKMGKLRFMGTKWLCEP